MRATTCFVYAILAVAATFAAGGCHTTYQCPILQPMTLGTIPAPLPPAPNDATDNGSGMPQRAYVGGTPALPWPQGDAYKVIGYRDGIRFYIVQYNDKLYRGGDILSDKGAEALKTLGIKTIISVTPSGTERDLAAKFGLKLVELPFGTGDMSRADLDKFIAAVDGNPTPIYVHCFGGDLRAGALLAWYRMKKEGWSFDRALNEYRRLDVNYWDSTHMVDVLRENAGK